MFRLEITINETTRTELIAALYRVLPDAQHTLRLEATARGLGFNTYAALLAFADQRSQVPRQIDAARFVEFLEARSCNVQQKHFYNCCAQAVLADICRQEPRLTHHGIGLPSDYSSRTGWPSESRETRLLKERRALIEAPEQFLRALCLMQSLPKIKSFPDIPSSYGLKHTAERLTAYYPDNTPLGPDYVANGSLIAAALYAGFEMKTFRDTLNVQFNISKKAISAINDSIRRETEWH